MLFVQDDIADKVIGMLAGAMDELKVGDPGLLSTDVGPVIDADARQILDDHAARMDREAKLIASARYRSTARARHLLRARARGNCTRWTQLTARKSSARSCTWCAGRRDDLDKVIDAINATGYGLTLGIHSRIDDTIDRIAARAKVGNFYVNRNQIGAVVGVQPFGGQGLSGTGPKAGGPHYLPRFATEKTVTVNTTAAGGNATLLTLGD